jgi:hypothetical protein
MPAATDIAGRAETARVAAGSVVHSRFAHIRTHETHMKAPERQPSPGIHRLFHFDCIARNGPHGRAQRVLSLNLNGLNAA